MEIKKAKSKFFLSVLIFSILLLIQFTREKTQNFVYLISSPIQSFFWRTGRKTFQFFEGVFDVEKIIRENEDLKKENQRLATENFLLLEKEKENEFLKKALDLGLEKEFRLQLAEVIFKDFTQDSLIIDKGKKDGIEVGMPVITNEKVLIGKISEVFNNFSKVTLVSAKNFNLDVQLGQKEIYGVSQGEGNLKLKVIFLPSEAEVKEGDYFFTSSLGNFLPKGLLVGKVKKIETSDLESEKKVWLELGFKLSDLSYVFVIQSW